MLSLSQPSCWGGGDEQCLGTAVSLGAPDTLRTCNIPARGMEIPRAPSWVSEADSLPYTERSQKERASL